MDNVNIRSKHHNERLEDNPSDLQYDWMGSLWIQERIDANHMKHIGFEPLKKPLDLSIQDFIPTAEEKNYIFTSLAHYYSYRLTYRHPAAFKSLNSSIKINKVHQFEDEMSQQSKEFTGELFTKSESKIEDLVDMMSTLQDKYTHKYEDGTEIKCYERKVISGDNKTEKNSHHGIIRYTEGSMNELLKLRSLIF